MFNIDKIPLDDKETFDLISIGSLNKGLFQIESNLCKQWSKRLKPRTIEELSNLIALIRPGSLPLAGDYLKRKRGEEEISYLDDRLKKYLERTQGIILFQEQILSIVQDLAKYSPTESDSLRKFIGKKMVDKLKEELPKLEKAFIDNEMKEESAKELVKQIEYAGGYSFNESHSISYGFNSYHSAYLKAHYPTVFFWANLKMSDNKQDQMEEISELYYDAKKFGVEIVPPSIFEINDDFEIIGDKKIAFGFRSIKGFGKNGIKQIKKIKGKDVSCWELFIKNAITVKKNIVEVMIKSGILDCYDISRSRMAAEYEIIRSLTANQRKVFIEKYSPDNNNVEGVIHKIPEENKRLRIGKNTLMLLKEYKENEYRDFSMKLEAWERHYLGINLITSKVEDYHDREVDSDIATINNSASGNFCFIGILEKCNIIKTKKDNREMAFLCVSDKTGMAEGIVVFPDTFVDLYYNKNTLKKEKEEIVKIRAFKKTDPIKGESIIAKDIVKL